MLYVSPAFCRNYSQDRRRREIFFQMNLFPNDPVVVLSAVRSPIGNFMGELAGLSAPQLGAACIRDALGRVSLEAHSIEELMFGCVLTAGVGQAPARQAALAAGLARSTACTTINKVCGSGMRAVMALHDTLTLGQTHFALAGGMESMSNAPHLLPQARAGHRFGHASLLDHMLKDGLEDAYDCGRTMGQFGEDCAREYGFGRAEQDEFAIESITRARKASESGAFKDEIVQIKTVSSKGSLIVESDEGPRTVNIERIPNLKPAFVTDGTVTAASSSSISDGAAALVLCRQSTADTHGIAPLARIVGHCSFAQEPSRFATAPIGAINKLLQLNNWRVADIDLWEINEAFAVVVMAAMQQLRIDHRQVNVHGGACAIGHPIGASGARIIVTLVHALRRLGARRGIASLCIGGGEATAIGLEIA